MDLHAAAKGFDPRHLSRRRALHLAVDISIAVAALILWALLSHVNWSRSSRVSAAEDCVFLGRAGADCVEKASRDGGAVPPERKCEFLGRAGEYCAPETTSK